MPKGMMIQHGKQILMSQKNAVLLFLILVLVPLCSLSEHFTGRCKPPAAAAAAAAADEV
jgi:hypothetical protein